MAHIKENDLMLAFYLASPPLQKQILSEYQHQHSGNNIRKNLLTFLEERFEPELTVARNIVKRNRPHIGA